MHHVPAAAPGDEGRDPDRALLAAVPVHQPRAAHVPVAHGVVAGPGIDPGRLGLGHDDPDQGVVPGAAAQEVVRGGHVEPEVPEEPGVPVRRRVGDGLDLGVGRQREKRLRGQAGAAGDHGRPQIGHLRAENLCVRAGQRAGLGQPAGWGRCRDHGRLPGGRPVARRAAGRGRGGRPGGRRWRDGSRALLAGRCGGVSAPRAPASSREQPHPGGQDPGQPALRPARDTRQWVLSRPFTRPAYRRDGRRLVTIDAQRVTVNRRATDLHPGPAPIRTCARTDWPGGRVLTACSNY